MERKIPRNKEFVQDLNFLFGVVDSLHVQFYTWKLLHDKKFSVKRKMSAYIFTVILKSMQDQILISLSKIVCVNSDSINLQKFANKFSGVTRSKISEFLLRNKTLISKIKTWRDNYLAHFDTKFSNKNIDLEKDYSLKKGDIEDLVLELSELIEIIACDNIYDPLLLNHFFLGERCRLEDEINKFYSRIN